MRLAVVLLALAAAALLSWPAVREARRLPEGADAWKRDYFAILPRDLARMMATGESRVIVVDTREDAEYADYHIPFALRIPVRDIPGADLRDLKKADLVICYCVKDLRGFEAARLLQQRGVANAGLIDGFGIYAWESAGLPVAGIYSGLTDEEAMKRIRESLR